MARTNIVTLDLNFQNKTQAIASYLIRHATGAVLVESGPGSTLSALQAGLAREGLSPRDITHVLLTHIHLDHAGAAGWLSRHGAQVFVHPNGAAHMLNPEKLIASATRIYGDRMDTLWGEFLPVLEQQLTVPQDAEEIAIGNLRFVAVNTPGHAEHHYSYLFEDLCFSGDVGGVRIPGYPYLRAPMPPPELHFGRWRESIARLRSLKFTRIAPTHFGIFDDVDWHLNELQSKLDASEKWLEETMPADPPVDELRARFVEWMNEQGRAQNLSEDVVTAYALANPLDMSVDGMVRYWKKART
ncbi:MBL fold metallo-hydrolase [Candidatus Villigracilis saccharophilus]|uniref:MBL fold metallo-hydrolase n=1 Tax=Candidatus Villigracilis saccharophilus TaxID=3140684 RepID=UPI00313699C5|nr:MBL fold metallo-hydrolase [Anaerolineales bacterium]